MSMLIQFVFKARPGTDLAEVIERTKMVAKLWKKHGAKEISFWNVSAGEIGNMAFTVPFESYTEYGKCYDALIADAEFRKWQNESSKLGLTEWVRTNIARKISLD